MYTDEYAIYSRLEEWGYSHKTPRTPQSRVGRNRQYRVPRNLA
ncbi:MAG: hypothetical protein WCK96_12750 [Methylococcales bacterium]